ncbi:hypothetical protein [Sulfurimonas sp.]|uniref:hypothetical protein n=1 Tax=Sulfurimonas sp. TaxID=2022749 RepID=UPI003D0BC09D
MKGKAHKFITEKVLEYFSEEFDFSENERYWIARGSTAEDSIFLPTKGAKWHFYRYNSFIKKHIGLCINPISETRLKTLSARIKWLLGDENKAETLGNIIHHIQNMNTPKHVLPIYQEVGKTDSYEKYMMSRIKDMEFLSTINKSITPRDWFDIYDSSAQLNCSKVNRKATHREIDAVYEDFTKQTAQTTYEALKYFVIKFKNQ